ncbi:MAG: type II toxin-antitoxin system VapC family toxin [Anaerolineales bacterium]|nr:type II toxin-antitoxin system VapC family toxin [Anaerolineales bacterium]
MGANPARFVLDSFALLAFLEGESGMARVKSVLRDAEKGGSQVFLSWINLGEVLYITEREQGQQQARETLAHIQSLPIQMLEVTPQDVLDAAHIKATHRLSYADAFAVVAALAQGAAVLTGDPEFENLKELVTVEWLAAH